MDSIKRLYMVTIVMERRDKDLSELSAQTTLVFASSEDDSFTEVLLADGIRKLLLDGYFIRIKLSSVVDKNICPCNGDSFATLIGGPSVDAHGVYLNLKRLSTDLAKREKTIDGLKSFLGESTNYTSASCDFDFGVAQERFDTTI